MRSQIQKKPVSNPYSPPTQKATSWQRPFSDPIHDPKQDGTVQSKIAPGAGFNLMQMKLFPDAPTPVQAKLKVGAPGDKYEQEADSMANKVMTMPAPEKEEPIQREVLPEEKKEEKVQTKPLAATITPLVQREIAPEEPQEEEEVQTKALSNPTIQRETTPEEPQEEEEVQAKALSSPTIQRETTPEEPQEEEEVQTKALSSPTIQRETTPEEPKKEEDLPVQAKAESEGKSSHNSNLESQLNGSKGGGSPLPDEVRAFMEPRFGADFSGVRVHTDGAAVQMNKELGAQAFAHGSDIYYGGGKSPGKDELTAHELTHVAQQGGKAAKIQKRADNPNPVPKADIQLAAHHVIPHNVLERYQDNASVDNASVRNFIPSGKEVTLDQLVNIKLLPKFDDKKWKNDYSDNKFMTAKEFIENNKATDEDKKLVENAMNKVQFAKEGKPENTVVDQSEVSDISQSFFMWSPANIFYGPEGQQRDWDPGEEFDTDAKYFLSEEHFNLLYRINELMSGDLNNKNNKEITKSLRMLAQKFNKVTPFEAQKWIYHTSQKTYYPEGRACKPKLA